MRGVPWLFAAALALACTNDYERFEVNPGAGGVSGGGGLGGSGATGGQAGATSGGGAGGSGASGGCGGDRGGRGGRGGDTGGSGGTSASGGTSGTGGMAGSGGGNCNPGQKPCGSNCVPDNDPTTGCAQASCNACPNQNATSQCQAGACALSCNLGAFDCDGQVSTGCEHLLSAPTNQNCGGCDNDCTSQGFLGGFTCASGLCRCTSATQCKDGGGGAADCNGNGRCTCTGVECQPGEACRKTGPNQECSCNGGAACAPGTVCCKVPVGCKDLTSDNANCGACGHTCPSGQACVGGSCQ
jgi:hypothetical protein